MRLNIKINPKEICWHPENLDICMCDLEKYYSSQFCPSWWQVTCTEWWASLVGSKALMSNIWTHQMKNQPFLSRYKIVCIPWGRPTVMERPLKFMNFCQIRKDLTYSAAPQRSCFCIFFAKRSCSFSMTSSSLSIVGANINCLSHLWYLCGCTTKLSTSVPK